MTPAEKLARSRLALVEYLQRRERGGRPRTDRPPEHPQEPKGDDVGTNKHSLRRRLGGMSGAAKNWWSHHPVQLVIDMATPSLQAYMRKRPFRVLGIAAALGATLVVTRAWRAVSLGTLLVALVKSSQFSGAVLSAFSDVGGRPAEALKDIPG